MSAEHSKKGVFKITQSLVNGTKEHIFGLDSTTTLVRTKGSV